MLLEIDAFALSLDHDHAALLVIARWRNRRPIAILDRSMVARQHRTDSVPLSIYNYALSGVGAVLSIGTLI